MNKVLILLGVLWPSIAMSAAPTAGPLLIQNDLSEIAQQGSAAQLNARVNIGISSANVCAGCGTIATQDYNAVSITGGTISGISSLDVAGNETVGNTTSAAPVAITTNESANGASKRSAIQIGTGWLIGQDQDGTGTKDLFIYGASGQTPAKWNPDGRLSMLWLWDNAATSGAYTQENGVTISAGLGTASIAAGTLVSLKTEVDIGNTAATTETPPSISEAAAQQLLSVAYRNAVQKDWDQWIRDAIAIDNPANIGTGSQAPIWFVGDSIRIHPQNDLRVLSSSNNGSFADSLVMRPLIASLGGNEFSEHGARTGDATQPATAMLSISGFSGHNCSPDTGNASDLWGLMCPTAGGQVGGGITSGSPATFTIVTTGATVSGATVTVGSTANLAPGMPITGTNIPAADTVSVVNSGTQFTLAASVTGGGISNGATLTFYPSGDAAQYAVRIGGGGGSIYLPYNARSQFQTGMVVSDYRLNGILISAPIPGFTSYPLTTAPSDGLNGFGILNPVDTLQVAHDTNIGANDPTGNGVSQLLVSGATNSLQRLSLGYDTTNDAGVIQAALTGTGVKPLYLNPRGGAVYANGAPLPTFGTPASSSAACVQGQIMFDATYIYTCIATSTWHRVSNGATW